jgi:4-amino-4-deoxy-L-arabinose transferase-like glycosyltransferase
VDERSDQSSSIAIPGIGTISRRTLIVTVVIVAALLRMMWAWRHGLSIEMEGAEYARIGENLLKGRGYVGMFNNGTQLNFPPLYPLMIGAVSILTGSSEVAARVVNIACGAALVIPAFGIAERLYGRRVGVTVAALVALHPTLIAGGASTYAEGPYLTFLLTAVFWMITWVARRQLRAIVLAGVFFGLAYLIRPEGIVMAGGFVGAMLAATAVAAIPARDRRATLLAAIALSATVFLVALPNIVFLTHATGKIRVQAKGTLAYQWGQRINSGMPYLEAVSGIGDDLSEQGVFMRSNLEVLNSAAPTTRQYVAFLLKAARRNVRDLDHALVDEHAFGSPALFVLVVIGLLRSPWDRRRMLLEGVLVLTISLNILVLLTVQALWFRYFYPFLGVLLIWAANGAEEIGQWSRASAASVIDGARRLALIGRVVTWGAVATVLAFAAWSTPSVGQFNESQFPERVRAGRWIASQSHEPWIMDSGLQTAYYAGGNLKSLPYANSDTALRYIAKQKPDFIVLHSFGKSDFPYGANWFDNAIPDQRAVLVHREPLTHMEEIKIYRWVDPPQSGQARISQ